MAENRLIHEKSPYLLEHAHNPVDWYPWGPQAFEKARREQKPIFLSIGYSTCHWCHVMGRESFADSQVAAALNRDFVAIKVDREERPDVDAVYMEACQAMTGAGGWPLTILMTPEQKPFWAGTYLPKRGGHGQPGLLALLAQVAKLWRENRAGLLETGDTLAAHLARQEEAPGEAPAEGLTHTAARQLRQSYDPQNGGFGPAPKFPCPQNLLFLLQYARQAHHRPAREMAETTLAQMARGGIFDQLGGGFSRYATDEAWLVPHFEKMLYDNALLAYAYLEAYRQSGNAFFCTVARRTLDYVLRELTGPDGEFYCGQDADSGGEEGAYYLFTPQEVTQVLGPADGQAFCAWYGMHSRGNFEGKCILNLLENAGFLSPPPQLPAWREKLLRYRAGRMALHRDDKVLCAWNALMVAALAKAARVLGEPAYARAARRALAFLSAHLSVPGGRVLVRWRDGEGAGEGLLCDYAFFAWALLEAYAAGYDAAYLSEAARLAGQMEALFLDEAHGGYYLTARDAETLLARPKELYDGAMPSGNAVAALVLVRLWKLCGELCWRDRAQRQLSYIAGNCKDYPAGHCFSLLALGEWLSPSRELICAAPRGELPAGLGALCAEKGLYTLVKTNENAEALARVAPFSAPYPVPGEGVCFYLCQNGGCHSPVYTLEALRALLP